jgi:hypothetical protein
MRRKPEKGLMSGQLGDSRLLQDAHFGLRRRGGARAGLALCHVSQLEQKLQETVTFRS